MALRGDHRKSHTSFCQRVPFRPRSSVFGLSFSPKSQSHTFYKNLFQIPHFPIPKPTLSSWLPSTFFPTLHPFLFPLLPFTDSDATLFFSRQNFPSAGLLFWSNLPWAWLNLLHILPATLGTLLIPSPL